MRKQTFFYLLTLASLLTTLALIIIWNAWLSPPVNLPIALVLIVLVTPLLLVFNGILNERRKHYIWLSFIALFYFTLGVGDAYSDPGARIYGITLVTNSMIMFMASLAYLKAATNEPKIDADTPA